MQTLETMCLMVLTEKLLSLAIWVKQYRLHATFIKAFGVADARLPEFGELATAVLLAA